MIRIVLAFGIAASLAGCGTGYVQTPGVLSFGGPANISGMSPPAPYARNSVPQPVNSLPLYAQGVGAPTEFTPPNFASVTFAFPRW